MMAMTTNSTDHADRRVPDGRDSFGAAHLVDARELETGLGQQQQHDEQHDGRDDRRATGVHRPLNRRNDCDHCRASARMIAPR